jgi:hypothetical protein
MPQWCTEVVQGYNSDPQAQRFLAKLTTSTAGFGQFVLSDGIIRHNNRIWWVTMPMYNSKSSGLSTVHLWGSFMHSSYNQAYSGILYLVWSSETC